MPATTAAFVTSTLLPGTAYGVSAGTVTFASAAATSVAAGAVYAGTYAVTAAAISYGFSAVSQELFGPDMPNFDESPGARLDMVRDPSPPRRFVYGETRVSGPMVFAQADQRKFDGDEQEMLHYDVVLASHPIESFVDVYLNDEKHKFIDLVSTSNEAWPVYGSLNRIEATSDMSQDPFRLYGSNTFSAGEIVVVKNIPANDDNYGDGEFVIFEPNANNFKLKFGSDVVEFTETAETQVTAYAEDGGGTTDNNGVTRYAMPSGVYQDSVMLKLYDGSQTTADADAIANTNVFDSDGRKSTDVGYDLTYGYVAAKHDGEVFNDGVPTLSAVIKGKNDIYDPRDSNFKYTNNPVLCLVDWMITPRNQGGGGWDYDEFNESAIITAANVCDDDLSVLDDGTTGKRYRCAGTIVAGTPRYTVIQRFLDSFAGNIERVNGLWYIKAGKFVTPTLTLTEGNWIQPVSVQMHQSLADSFNAIKPVMAGEFSEYQETAIKEIRGERFGDGLTVDGTADTITQPTGEEDFDDHDLVRFDVWTGSGFDPGLLPANIEESKYYWVINSNASTWQIAADRDGTPISISSPSSGDLVAFEDVYLGEDQGKRRQQDKKFHLVNDPEIVRRLSFISLKRSRKPITMDVVSNLVAFDLQVSDIVRVIDSERGFWASDGSSFSPDTQGVVFETAHGRNEGDPLVVISSGTSGLREDTVYYVRDVTADEYKLARYPGMPAVSIDSSQGTTLQPVKGKIFEVRSWSFGPYGEVLGVGMSLQEIDDDNWDWDNSYVTATEDEESINVSNPRDISAPTGLTADGGGDHILLNRTGDIVFRAGLDWDASGDAQISVGGRYEIEQRLSSETEWEHVKFVDGAITTTFAPNLIGGETYDFRIRGMTALGFFTAWTQVDDVSIDAKPPAPDNWDWVIYWYGSSDSRNRGLVRKTGYPFQIATNEDTETGDAVDTFPELVPDDFGLLATADQDGPTLSIRRVYGVGQVVSEWSKFRFKSYTTRSGTFEHYEGKLRTVAGAKNDDSTQVDSWINLDGGEFFEPFSASNTSVHSVFYRRLHGTGGFDIGTLDGTGSIASDVSGSGASGYAAFTLTTNDNNDVFVKVDSGSVYEFHFTFEHTPD